MQKAVLKIFAIFSLFNEVAGMRDSNTGVFLLILQNFQEHPF